MTRRILCMNSKLALLTEEDVMRLLDMRTAIEAVEEAARAYGNSKATNYPRRRHRVPNGLLHVMDASLPTAGVMGLKSYSVMKDGTTQFHVLLYSSETGKLRAFMEAEWMGRMRTGAASAVAAKFLAREDASTVGLVGAGRQAAAQLEAVCLVRPVKHVSVFSTTPEKLAEFCLLQSNKLGIPVQPASSVEEAVTEKDLVITATNSRAPFLNGRWLKKGCHLTAIGANHPLKQELMENVFAVLDRIVVDSIEQTKLESVEFQTAIDAGTIIWEEISEIGPIVAGFSPGRVAHDDITLFKSHGLALWDIAVAAKVVSLACQKEPTSHPGLCDHE